MKDKTQITLSREEFNTLYDMYVHFHSWIPIIDEDYPNRTWGKRCRTIRDNAHKIMCKIDNEFFDEDTISSNSI